MLLLNLQHVRLQETRSDICIRDGALLEYICVPFCIIIFSLEMLFSSKKFIFLSAYLCFWIFSKACGYFGCALLLFFFPLVCFLCTIYIIKVFELLINHHNLDSTREEQSLNRGAGSSGKRGNESKGLGLLNKYKCVFCFLDGTCWDIKGIANYRKSPCRHADPKPLHFKGKIFMAYKGEKEQFIQEISLHIL